MKFLTFKGMGNEAGRYFIADSVKAIIWWFMVIGLILLGVMVWVMQRDQDVKIANYKMVAKACMNYDHIEARVETVAGSNQSSLVFYCR